MPNPEQSNQNDPNNPPPEKPFLPGRYEYLIWLFVVLMTSLYFFSLNSGTTPPKTLSYSELISQVEQGQITAVQIQGQQLRGRTQDATTGFDFRTTLPDFVDHSLLDTLNANHVTIDIKSSQTPVGCNC